MTRIDIVNIESPYDSNFFTYSDGSTAVVSTTGAKPHVDHNKPTSISVVNHGDDTHDLMDLLIEQNPTSEPTTFAREANGYNKNAVDSYIHHIHTLLIKYGKLLKTKDPQTSLTDKEMHEGIPKFRSTRVDVILEELVYANRLVAFFRKQVNEERLKNMTLQETIDKLEQENTILRTQSSQSQVSHYKHLTFDTLKK